MSRTPQEIRELQLILDHSDPFLLEAMHGKTLKELEETLMRLMREKDVIPRENAQWLERQNNIIKTISALIDMKKAYQMDDDDGGVSLV